MQYFGNTTAERSSLMKKIRGMNTQPEIKLRKALWAKGYRYRKNFSALPGKPDIVLPKPKIAIFIDGEFWHGYNWEEKKPRIKTNREYWVTKIERNIERDKVNTRLLEDMGYTVLRFWEVEIKKNLEDCIEKIETVVRGR